MADWMPFSDFDAPIYIERAFAIDEVLPRVNYRPQPKFAGILVNVTTDQDGTLNVYQVGADNVRSLYHTEAVAASDVVTQLDYTYRPGMTLQFQWVGGATAGTVSVQVLANGTP